MNNYISLYNYPVSQLTDTDINDNHTTEYQQVFHSGSGSITLQLHQIIILISIITPNSSMLVLLSALQSANLSIATKATINQNSVLQ